MQELFPDAEGLKAKVSRRSEAVFAVIGTDDVRIPLLMPESQRSGKVFAKPMV